MLSKRLQISRKVLAYFIAIMILFSGSMSYLAYNLGFTNAQGVGLTANTLTGGNIVGAPTYTVFVDNSVYYAKNEWGSVIFASTNASYILNTLASHAGTTYICQGHYDIDTPILITSSGVSIIGEGKGVTVFDYTGIAGNNIISIPGTTALLDIQISQIQFLCNDKANALSLDNVMRFKITDLTIAGGTSSNEYSGILLYANAGTVAWGTIDNVYAEYVGYGIQFTGYNESIVVTDLSIGSIFTNNVKHYGLRFVKWCDSIDINYFYGEMQVGATNTAGAIFNNATDSTIEQGVYDISINKLIYDVWQDGSGSYCIIMNCAKEIIIRGSYNNDVHNTYASLSSNAISYYIVKQGQNVGNNTMTIISKGIDIVAGP